MKKVVIIITIILILILIGLFRVYYSFFTINTKNENKISVEEYENKSYLQNIVKYRIINDSATKEKTMLVNVDNEKDIQSIKYLFVESDKIDSYSYAGEKADFYMIAYLFDNSAIKIEGVKDEVKITSVDDENSVEYYRLRIENDFQEYLSRKYSKYAKNAKYYIFKENEKLGIIDSQNVQVFQAKYDDIKIINDYTDLFLCTDGNKKEFLDINENNYLLNIGENISEIQVAEIEERIFCDILTYEMNGKYGLLNIKGDKITGLEYEKVYSLGYLKNYIILEKEDSKKQLCKINSYGLEMLGEYDEFLVKKDDTLQEFVISGKNENEEEQVIVFEKIENVSNNYPETLSNLERVYENGIYFYKEKEVEIENMINNIENAINEQM